MKKFTEQDLKDYRSYERVRAGGRYNMFDPRARRATGLTEERYIFVMDNFTELEEACDGPTDTPAVHAKH